MNYKETLIKLHKRFPQFDTDTLIDILNCMDNSYVLPELSRPELNRPDPGITWMTGSVLGGPNITCKTVDNNISESIKAEAHI